MIFCIIIQKEILGDNNYIIALVGNENDLYIEQEIYDEQIENKAKELKIKLKITSAAIDIEDFQKFLNEEYTTKYKPQETKEDGKKI